MYIHVIYIYIYYGEREREATPRRDGVWETAAGGIGWDGGRISRRNAVIGLMTENQVQVKTIKSGQNGDCGKGLGLA